MSCRDHPTMLGRLAVQCLLARLHRVPTWLVLARLRKIAPLAMKAPTVIGSCPATTERFPRVPLGWRSAGYRARRDRDRDEQANSEDKSEQAYTEQSTGYAPPQVSPRQLDLWRPGAWIAAA